MIWRLKRRYAEPQMRGMLLFYDEFRLVPHLEHIDDGVNFGRSLGAKIFCGYSEY